MEEAVQDLKDALEELKMQILTEFGNIRFVKKTLIFLSILAGWWYRDES